jgi:hypothetical protein
MSSGGQKRHSSAVGPNAINPVAARYGNAATARRHSGTIDCNVCDDFMGEVLGPAIVFGLSISGHQQVILRYNASIREEREIHWRRLCVFENSQLSGDREWVTWSAT